MTTDCSDRAMLRPGVSGEVVPPLARDRPTLGYRSGARWMKAGIPPPVVFAGVEGGRRHDATGVDVGVHGIVAAHILWRRHMTVRDGDRDVIDTGCEPGEDVLAGAVGHRGTHLDAGSIEQAHGDTPDARLPCVLDAIGIEILPDQAPDRRGPGWCGLA